MSSDGRPRLRLLLFNSSGVLAQLRWVGFRRMDLQTSVANSAEEILDALGAPTLPDAVVLEHCPSSLDAFRVCQRIRDELGHDELPLVVISKTGLSHGMLARISDSGCNEVLTAPLAPGQLHFTLCKYLDLPRRCEEQLAAAGPVTVEGDTRATGRVRDVSKQGARIQLPDPFEARPGQQVRCGFGVEPDLQVEARVVWRRRAASGGTELAVQFAELSEGLVSRLENLATWRLEEVNGDQLVILHGSLTETSCFSELVPLVRSSCVFDLHNVSMINSMGVSRWVTLLRQLDAAGISYSLSGCSVAFCTQANYLSEMLGQGKVLSFFIPLECPSCTQEVERELPAEQITRLDEPDLPVFDCPSCGTTLVFADLPQRYFQFLT